MNREPLLTMTETIVYLGLGSESAVYRAIREHDLPFLRLGRRYRFRQTELDAWLARGRQATAVGPRAVAR